MQWKVLAACPTHKFFAPVTSLLLCSNDSPPALEHANNIDPAPIANDATTALKSLSLMFETSIARWRDRASSCDWV
jgi:hypothetical protein